MPPRQQAPPATQPAPRQPVAPVVAGVLAADAVGRAGAVPATVASKAIEAAIEALTKAFALRLTVIPPELLGFLREQHPEMPDEEARRVARMEIAREREFQTRVLARVRGDLGVALRIEDPAKRSERIQAILDREAYYGRLREQAMFARAVARVEGEILKTVSPQGAFWRLSDLTAGNHTPDCIAMANKFWPWSVLRSVHPPLHLHCPCTLHGLGEAVSRGWMTEDGVRDEKVALASARRILRDHPEHSIARRELREGRFEEDLHPRDRLGKFMDKLGLRHYKVGGAVRDRLLGHDPKDVDYIAFASPEEIAKKVEAAGHRADPLIVRDRLVGVRAYGDEIPKGGVEIAPPRIETAVGGSDRTRQDFEIVPHPGVYGDNVAEPMAQQAMLATDAQRRDFTLNALYEDPATGAVLDPTGVGRDDLAAGVLRTTSRDSFRDDPLRMLRAIRFVSRFGFDLAPETEKQMREHAASISVLTQKGVSGTAVEELNKILMGEHVGKALRLARDTGVLAAFLPELAPSIGWDQRSKYHDLTLDEHTFSVVENAAAQGAPLEVRLAALFHDAGKPEVAFEGKDGYLHFYGSAANKNKAHEEAGAEIAERALTRLNYPAAVRSAVVRLVRAHMVPLAASKRPSAARRFRAEVGPDLVDPLLTLRRADVSSKGEGEANPEALNQLNQFAERVRAEAGSPTEVKDLNIDGNDLLALGIPRGPIVGEIQRALLHEVIASPELNNREWLLKRAASMVGKQSWGVTAAAVPNQRERMQATRDTIADRLHMFSYNGLNAQVVSKVRERINLRIWPSGDLNGEVGYAQVSVYRDRVHIDRVYLQEDQRAKGFGSALMLELFDAARDAGISEATLETTDVGGYAWARAGFVWDTGWDATRVWDDAVDNDAIADLEDDYGAEVVADFHRFIWAENPSEYEVAMWGREHAKDGKWPGKDLLLGKHWEGRLDL